MGAIRAALDRIRHRRSLAKAMLNEVPGSQVHTGIREELLCEFEEERDRQTRNRAGDAWRFSWKDGKFQ